MTEIIINTIGNVRSADSTSMFARAPASTPTQLKIEAPSSPAPKTVLPNQEKVSASLDKNQNQKQPESVSAALVSNMSNISLQFRVDEKTKDVTIFVVDRKSKKVLRSIPSSELAKLRAGDLLKLTA